MTDAAAIDALFVAAAATPVALASRACVKRRRSSAGIASLESDRAESTATFTTTMNATTTSDAIDVSDVAVRTRLLQLQLSASARKKSRNRNDDDDHDDDDDDDDEDDEAVVAAVGSAEATPVKRKKFMRKQRAHFAAVDDVELQEEVVDDPGPLPPLPLPRHEAESAENRDRNAPADADEDEAARKVTLAAVRRVKSPFRTYSRRSAAASAPEQPDA